MVLFIMEITTIQVRHGTRKLLQLRKQELGLKNVDDVIIQALELSGPQAIKESKEKK